MKIDLHTEVSTDLLKLDDNAKVKEQYQAAFTGTPSVETAPSTPAFTFDDFKKVDLRVGTIKTAERVPKSKKLVKLSVSFGPLGDRQIVAGIGAVFEPDALIGKQIVAVVNLPSANLMGVESNGMLLAGSADSTLFLVSCPGAADGTQLG